MSSNQNDFQPIECPIGSYFKDGIEYFTSSNHFLSPNWLIKKAPGIEVKIDKLISAHEKRTSNLKVQHWNLGQSSKHMTAMLKNEFLERRRLFESTNSESLIKHWRRGGQLPQILTIIHDFADFKKSLLEEEYNDIRSVLRVGRSYGLHFVLYVSALSEIDAWERAICCSYFIQSDAGDLLYSYSWSPGDLANATKVNLSSDFHDHFYGILEHYQPKTSIVIMRQYLTCISTKSTIAKKLGLENIQPGDTLYYEDDNGGIKMLQAMGRYKGQLLISDDEAFNMGLVSKEKEKKLYRYGGASPLTEELYYGLYMGYQLLRSAIGLPRTDPISKIYKSLTGKEPPK